VNGGEAIAAILQRHGVRVLFTLCGGHISPILVGAQTAGIRVVDVRHEATAVFAADAMARLTGIPGVAAVTAGPGLTNTLTALRNASMAASPLVLLGGATATALRGRGALQDIDQAAAVRSHVKEVLLPKTLPELLAAVERAFRTASAGVPGPVFVETPVDLLYGEELVRSWYRDFTPRGSGLADRAVRWYLTRHAERLFRGAVRDVGPSRPAEVPVPPERAVARARTLLAAARRPLLVLGSDAVADPSTAEATARAVRGLGVPVYLSGMARGLLGRADPLQLRHRRREALKEADLVLLGGMPLDFRMDYGRSIGRGTAIIAVGRDATSLRRNRRPTLAVPSDTGLFLAALAGARDAPCGARGGWCDTLRERDATRDREIRALAAAPSPRLNPLDLALRMEEHLGDDAVLVADGGDFVASLSYVLRPRSPLSWLDPGPFGTLGVGGGFSLAAALARPGAEVWLLWGDGSSGYSLSELDTFARHGLRIIAVVGNDGAWSQIAREQVEVLGDGVGTELQRSDYHLVAEGLGARGLLLTSPERISEVLQEARAVAATGRPVLINAHIDATDFRKGSISM